MSKEARDALERHLKDLREGRVGSLTDYTEIHAALDRLDELEESKTEWVLDLTALKGELEETVIQLTTANERIAELEAERDKLIDELGNLIRILKKHE